MTDIPTADEAAFLPHSIGPYLVEQELGAGAMGRVFRAVHTGLDRAVALKVLRPDMLQDPGSVRRFLREARSIAQLDHPHIVAVYDAGEAGGLFFIAMKLLEGETLQAMLTRDGALPIERTVRIGSQLASALDYAHARDVAHLDVKPANVIVGKNDWAWLTDFSIAQALHPGATRSATITGTPLYMSPEQIQGEGLDSRADIYSLGVLLYQMCSGRTPFEGQFVTVMYAHLHTPPPDIRSFLPDMSPDLASVIHRALAKDPAERYQTAGDVVRALRRLIPPPGEAGHTVALEQRELGDGPSQGVQTRDGTAAVLETAPEVELKPGRRRWRLYSLVGGIMAAVLVAVGGIFLIRGQGSPAVATGTVVLNSQPPGAAVQLDGRLRGRTPATLRQVAGGTHTVSLSLATYDQRSITFKVEGGKTVSMSAILVSQPITSLVEADNGALATAVQKVGNTLRGQRFPSIVSATALRRTPVWAVFALRLAPSARGVRNVRVRAQYRLYEPNGLQVANFPGRPAAVMLPRSGVQQEFADGVRLHAGRQLPAGQWHVRLEVDGHTLRTLMFTVTP